jgi:hypothetical protein
MYECQCNGRLQTPPSVTEAKKKLPSEVQEESGQE